MLHAWHGSGTGNVKDQKYTPNYNWKIVKETIWGTEKQIRLKEDVRRFFLIKCENISHAAISYMKRTSVRTFMLVNYQCAQIMKYGC